MNGEHHHHFQGFWKVTFGNVLTMMAMAGAALIYYITYDREFTIMKVTVRNLTELQVLQSKRIDDINVSGSQYSQRNLEKLVDVVRRDSERIGKVEEFTLQVLPRVQRIEDKLDSINDWIAEQKGIKKHE